MSKERFTLYITEQQKKRLDEYSKNANLPVSEIIRRALDAYLAWNDPTYIPNPTNPKGRLAHSSIPRLKDGSFLGQSL